MEKTNHFMVRPEKNLPTVRTPPKLKWANQGRTSPSLFPSPHLLFTPNPPHEGTRPLKLSLILLIMITNIYCIKSTKSFQSVNFYFNPKIIEELSQILVCSPRGTIQVPSCEKSLFLTIRKYFCFSPSMTPSLVDSLIPLLRFSL